MKREQIGVCGVDAGLIWIGDPCYILHKDPNAKEDYDKPPKDIGENWSGFCEQMNNEQTNNIDNRQFNFDMGHAGLGVCLGGFGGDGCFPVYVTRNDKGLVVKAEIVFDEDEY
jgi:hypothetical protein